MYWCTSAEILIYEGFEACYIEQKYLYWSWWPGSVPLVLVTIFQEFLQKHRNKRNFFKIKILIQHRKCCLNLGNPKSEDYSDIQINEVHVNAV